MGVLEKQIRGFLGARRQLVPEKPFRDPPSRTVIPLVVTVDKAGKATFAIGDEIEDNASPVHGRQPTTTVRGAVAEAIEELRAAAAIREKRARDALKLARESRRALEAVR